MLQLAAIQYLKSVGDKHFIPSPDYLEWADVGCLDIAIRRRPKWFWQNDKFFFDHMNIDDLLDSPLPGNMSSYLSKPEVVNPSFSWISKHDISSSIGGGIASLVSLDVTANDVVSVNIDMTDMVKQSIDFHKVVKVLKTKKINLNGDYIRRMANNKYNVICLITQYIYLRHKTEMKVLIDWNVGEDVKGTTITDVSLKDSGKVNYEKNKSIVFDAGTRLAFDYLELLINPDGSFELLDRSEETVRMAMIPKLPEINHALPNYCPHVTPTVDVPDNAKSGILSTPNDSCCIDKCKQVLDNEDIRNVTIDLLSIAIDDKTVLKQLDSFVLACQGAKTVDLSVFNENRNDNLLKLLRRIGIDTDIVSKEVIQSCNLNQDLIGQILVKIEALYQLELPYLQNLLSIIEEGHVEYMKSLFACLHNLKKDHLVDISNREKLFQDGKYKLLLLAVGVNQTNAIINEYFEPVFILLHAS